MRIENFDLDQMVAGIFLNSVEKSGSNRKCRKLNILVTVEGKYTKKKEWNFSPEPP